MICDHAQNCGADKTEMAGGSDGFEWGNVGEWGQVLTFYYTARGPE